MTDKLYSLSPRARVDLEEIWLYTYQRWSLEQANRYLRKLTGAMERLARGKVKGKRVAFDSRYLRVSIGSHIIFFRENGDDLHVIRILHARMDLPAQLDDA